jgi:putative ABC transport system substrate-binding protein
MVDTLLHQQVGAFNRSQVNGFGRLCPLLITLVMLMMSHGLLTNGAGAADRSRPVRIGVLTSSWGPTPETAGLRDGLLELGYREREDFVLGIRFTKGDNTALPGAARQLVQYGADLIFALNALAATAAQEATHQIPIVFSSVSNPVEFKLIQSFARPGGNLTGVSSLGIELGPKRLEVFWEMLPGLKRVLFPYDAADAEHLLELNAYRDAARLLGIVLIEKPLQSEIEAKTILAEIKLGAVDGILVPQCCSLNIPGFILETASQKRLPTMFEQAFWVEQGALASYGPDYYSSGQQAARLVAKIIKGEKPADIPVEVNSEIEFAINRKVAQAIGLTIAPEVLFQANRIIR